MPKYFKDSEWKKKRKEIIKEDSACTWCGSKEFLAVRRKETEETKILPINEFRFEKFKAEYNIRKPGEEEVSIFLSEEESFLSEPILKVFKHYSSKDVWELKWQDVGKFLNLKRTEASKIKKTLRELLKEQSKINWDNFAEDEELQEKIAKEYEAYSKPRIERYKKCLPEDIIILCRRCNFASMNGMELCPICKKKYKGVKYDTCFNCLPSDRKKQISGEEETD